MKAECLSQLAHFTATKVGTDGGFCSSKKHVTKIMTAAQEKMQDDR